MRKIWPTLIRFTVACVFLHAFASDAALLVRVEANPDPARPGDTVNVLVNVSNTGIDALADVVVEVIVPNEVDAFSAGLVSSGGTCTLPLANLCEQSEPVSWAIGSLAAGKGITLSIPPQISSGDSAPPDGTFVVFTANASASGVSPVGHSSRVEVQSGPFLTLGVVESQNPVAPGSSITFTLSFGHTATARLAPDAMLTMRVPAGTHFVSASDGGVIIGVGRVGSIVIGWSLGTLMTGQTGVRSATFSVDANVETGSLIEAIASIADADSPVQTARAVSVVRVDDGATLDISLEANPDSARPGNTMITQLTVSNTSAFLRTGVVATLRMADFLENFSEGLISLGGTCDFNVPNSCERREAITWSLGDLAAGQAITVSVPPIVNTSGLIPADGDLIRFDAIAFDSVGENASASRIVAVESDSAFTLAIVESHSPAASPALLTYTLSFGHIATARVAPGAVLRMSVPERTAFVSASDGGTLEGDTVEWALGTLAAGESGTRTLTVSVGAGSVDGLDGFLLEAHAAIADTADPPEQARANATTQIDSQAPLDIAIEANPDATKQAETLLTQITVANRSALPRLGVVARLRLPDFLAPVNVGFLSAGGTCSLNVPNLCERREEISWEIGDLAAGQSFTVSVPPIVHSTGDLMPADGDLIRFEAIAVDDVGENASASRVVAVQGDGFLTLAMTESHSPAAADTDLTYRLTYGHIATTGLAVTPLLTTNIPDGTTFVSASDGGALVGNNVEWELPNLAPGEAGVRTLTVRVGANEADGSLLEAHASIADAADPPERARANATTRIDSLAPIDIALEANPDPAALGKSILAQVTVTNASAVPRFDVVATLRTPDFLSSFNEAFVSAGGTCNFNVPSLCERREAIRWELGDLAAGESFTVSVPPIVISTGDLSPADGDLIRFEAIAVDADGEMASASRVVEVQHDAFLRVAIVESRNPAAASAPLRYDVSFGHTATDRSAPGTVLTMRVPDGTTFASASNGGVFSGDTVSWQLGTLASGVTGTRTLTVNVDTALKEGTLLEALAAITDTANPPERARANATTRVDSTAALEVSIASQPDGCPDGFTASCTIGTSIDVTNHAAFPVFDTELELQLPDGFDNLLEALVTGGGTCNFNVPSLCERREAIVWDFGTLDADETRSVMLPPTISAGVPDGELIRLVAVASYTQSDNLEQASARNSVLVPEPGAAMLTATAISMLGVLRQWGVRRLRLSLEQRPDRAR